MSDLAQILVVVLIVVLLVGLALRAGTLMRENRRLRDGGRVIVRCRDGHLFTTVWILGASFKAIRLGAVRFQWCPVGQHRTFVTRVPPSQLTDLQRRQAAYFDDDAVP